MVSSFAISTQSRLLGVFNLHFRQPRIFTRQQQQLLETLGQNLAVALDNQRLAAKARELAVLEERNLVAQGLHDSIAQGLSFLNLQAQMLEDALPFTVYATIRRADDAEYIVRSVLERVKWLDLYGMCRIVCLNPTNDPEIDAIIRRLVQKYPFAEIGAFQTRKNVL